MILYWTKQAYFRSLTLVLKVYEFSKDTFHMYILCTTIFLQPFMERLLIIKLTIETKSSSFYAYLICNHIVWFCVKNVFSVNKKSRNNNLCVKYFPFYFRNLLIEIDSEDWLVKLVHNFNLECQFWIKQGTE